MTWIKAYADNFTETKTDFFEMRNSSYKKRIWITDSTIYENFVSL